MFGAVTPVIMRCFHFLCYSDGVQDTLLRCAKLEVRKRALEAREQQLDEAYQQRMTSKYDAVEDATEEEGDDGAEDDDDEEEEDDEDVSSCDC
jgi:Mg-chelatase subunit ChlI